MTKSITKIQKKKKMYPKEKQKSKRKLTKLSQSKIKGTKSETIYF